MTTKEKAESAERTAASTNRRADWLEAARLWKAAGNTERANECRLNADECKN